MRQARRALLRLEYPLATNLRKRGTRLTNAPPLPWKYGMSGCPSLSGRCQATSISPSSVRRCSFSTPLIPASAGRVRRRSGKSQYGAERQPGRRPLCRSNRSLSVASLARNGAVGQTNLDKRWTSDPWSSNGQLFMASPYDIGLEKNRANFAPLTPLHFLDWSALACPQRTAVIYMDRRFTWAETHARCRRLASALVQRGIGGCDALEYTRDVRASVRRTNGRRRAQHAQRAARCSDHRLYARPR